MRLGDLDDLKTHISELMLVYSGTELNNAILYAIDNAPTVDIPCNDCCADTYRDGYEKGKADARPQGKWKTIEGIDGDEYYECSNCGEPWVLTAGTPKDNNMNFCPNCGAKMKGGAEE